MLMSMFISMFPLFMFLVGVMVFVLNRKHLLSMLLSLEFMVLSLFFLLFIYLNFMNYEMFFSMVFLTFSVCEGALGLSILVSMIRTHGNDYFQSFSIIKC
uniref:NADH-ubiquinone oxidoreductase chain 4L n=1 Tax=Microphor holosericeus TaxID=2498633 RepID=A0A7G7CE17_9MUSC|nr:NADH dehydrogenase subunit 4L [Microphor holosericeus]